MRAYKRLEVLLSKPDEQSLLQVAPERGAAGAGRVALAGAIAVVQRRLGSRNCPTPAVDTEDGTRYWQALSGGGVDGALYERPRQGAKPILSPTEQQRIIAMACSDAPDGRARWTVRLLAEQAIKRKIVPQVGRETIRILLESHDLKPWREKNVVRVRAQ